MSQGIEYTAHAYNGSKCMCGSHSLHALYFVLVSNPGINLKEAARMLSISYQAARQRASRLKRRPDLVRLCPNCFEPFLFSGVCQSCGYELDRPDLPLDVNFASQSPRYAIQPLSGLGSSTDYLALRPSYGHRNLRHLVERSPDPLLERCKSELWQALKEVMPEDSIVEEATRLLTREVHEFASRYPALVNSPRAKGQIVKNVLKVMILWHPVLRKCDGVTYIPPSEDT